jgi:PKD repeat protein
MKFKSTLLILIAICCLSQYLFSSPAIPIANFAASRTSICEGQCISFTDLSINNPTSWSWSFQGATLLSSSQQYPSNICYNTAGIYFVSLTVSNASGSNTLYQAGYITVYSSSVVNLLVNGDFNNYNTGFSSPLLYVPAGILSPDEYTVDTNAWYHNGGWAAISPDTTPFYMCDGSLTPGTIVWSENLTNVFPSSAYTFYFLMTNLDVDHSFIDPELQTTITDQGGTVLFTGTTGLLPAANSNNPPVYIWTTFSYVFSTLPNTTSITIALSQVGGVYLGFDFALENMGLKTHFCDSLAALPQAEIFTDENTICPGSCSDFLNLSTNATSFQWLFPGGTPAISNDVNPQSVCYNSPGSYDVTLIAANAYGTDTVVIPDFITVLPYPPPQGILQNGDTLFANAGAVFYQWFYNGVLIPGATDYFYFASSGGNYNVLATDTNGCQVEAAIFDVTASIQPAHDLQSLSVFPDPVNNRLDVYGLNHDSGTILIYNATGELVRKSENKKTDEQVIHIDIHTLPAGIYFLQTDYGGKIFRVKFVKSF